ncbi:hypothetical protein [Streptomyces sp. URMC 125]|uniref:hypothetical protein n=1 Tax=Streptomyces sp. URMC 125 TaxID=3423419 RepID=UPI003F1A306A
MKEEGQEGMSTGRRNKAKGYRFEKEFVDLLREEFPEIDPDEIRRNGVMYGTNDRGDIRVGEIAFVWELKNVQRFDLAGFMRELEREIQAHPKARNGAVVIKARMKPVKDAYAVMPLWRLLELVKENHDLKNQLRLERKVRKAA